MDPSASPRNSSFNASQVFRLRCKASISTIDVVSVPRVDFQGVVEEKRSPAVWKKTMFLRPHKVWGPKCRYFSMAKKTWSCWRRVLSSYLFYSCFLSLSTLLRWLVGRPQTCGAVGQAHHVWSAVPVHQCEADIHETVLIRFWTARRSCTFCFAVILLSLETLMLESQETWPFRLFDPKLTTLEMEKTHEALEAEILSRVRAGNFSFNDADWRHVSDLAKVGFTGLLGGQTVKLSNI